MVRGTPQSAASAAAAIATILNSPTPAASRCATRLPAHWRSAMVAHSALIGRQACRQVAWTRYLGMPLAGERLIRSPSRGSDASHGGYDVIAPEIAISRCRTIAL